MSDRRLIQLWVARREHPHLARCEACASRCTQLAALVDEIAADTQAEADAQYPPERLATQRTHVLRRLENAEHPARVISFPIPPRPVQQARPFARRWVAVAAAAGLLVGLAAGLVVDVHPFGGGFDWRFREAPAQLADGRAAPTQSALRAASPVDQVNEERFLLEVEAALDAPRIDELRVIDELTPSVSEVSTALFLR